MVRIGAGTTAAAALGGASALHALWATGSSWPKTHPDELADLVVGRRPMPSPAVCAAVAGALAVAAGMTARAAHGCPDQSDRSRAAATIVSAVLLARGAGGVVADLAGVVDATPTFRHWNRRLYNPLCLTLAVLVAAGRRPRP